MPASSTPVLTLTVTLSGTVAAKRFVTAAGAQAGADANTLGVARVAGVSGDEIAVDVLGTTIVEAGAAISAGATIKTNAAGKAVTWATSGPKVAIALQASGGNGDLIEVLLTPNAA